MKRKNRLLNKIHSMPAKKKSDDSDEERKSDHKDKKTILVKTKICNKCLKWLPVSRFTKNIYVKKTKKHARCKLCESKRRREAYRKKKLEEKEA